MKRRAVCRTGLILFRPSLPDRRELLLQDSFRIFISDPREILQPAFNVPVQDRDPPPAGSPEIPFCPWIVSAQLCSLFCDFVKDPPFIVDLTERAIDPFFRRILR